MKKEAESFGIYRSVEFVLIGEKWNLGFCFERIFLKVFCSVTTSMCRFSTRPYRPHDRRRDEVSVSDSP